METACSSKSSKKEGNTDKTKDDEDEDIEKRNWRPYAKEYDAIKVSSINGIGTFAHDKAAIRALQSTYKPEEEIPDQERLRKTLLVAKLAPLIAEEEVERLFSKFGKIVNVKIIRDVVTRRSKGYGFVEFDRKRHCDRAYDDGKHLSLGNTETLIVDKVLSRSMPGFVPRRLGGGFGGSKNSGQLRFGCRFRPWLRPTFKSERKKLKKM